MFTKVSLETYGLIMFSFLLFTGGYFYVNSYVQQNSSAIVKLYEMGEQHFTFYDTIAKIQLAISRKYYNTTMY